MVKDDDLVELIETAHLKKFQLKKEYGIISYNDTSLKKIVEKEVRETQKMKLEQKKLELEMEKKEILKKAFKG